jgi:DNA-binding transcriptional regulator YhcF (GntR family)
VASSVALRAPWPPPLNTIKTIEFITGKIIQGRVSRRRNPTSRTLAKTADVGLRCANLTYLRTDGFVTAARGVGMLSSYSVRHEIRRLPNKYVRKQLFF